MKTIQGMVMAALIAGVAAGASAATLAPAQAAVVCKAQAATLYANEERPARVKFKGIYGGNDSRKVRIQVLPADGSKAFLAICAVNGRTGEIVGLMPAARAEAPALAAAGGK